MFKSRQRTFWSTYTAEILINTFVRGSLATIMPYPTSAGGIIFLITDNQEILQEQPEGNLIVAISRAIAHTPWPLSQSSPWNSITQ